MNELTLEELNEKNVGLSFLWNPNEMQSSAILRLQWCIAPQLLEYLKVTGTVHAQVFISVENPNYRKTRYVVDLDSPQELLEFHCPGKHEITAQIVYTKGSRQKRYAASTFLRKRGRHSYEDSAHEVFSSIRYRGGNVIGNAQLSVVVAEGFFAPELSPWQEWYVNLWFGEPAWDECELRRRKWIAYTIQPPVVALWTLAMFALRSIVAFWLSVVCARTGVSWAPVLHPFADDIYDLWLSSRRRKLSYYQKLLVPANQLMILAAAVGFMLLGAAMNQHMPAVQVGIAAYGILLFTILIYPLTGVIGKRIMDPLNAWALRKASEIGDVAAIAKKVREEEKQHAMKQGNRLERLYADLVCTTAPADRSLRTRRQGFTRNLVLHYHDLKAKVCRPAARSW